MIFAINRWVWVFSALGIFAWHVDAKASQAYTYAADRTVNHEIHAVPAPMPVAIDGELDEWDTSGGILCCKDVNRVLDRYATRFYMMYDQDAFYVAANVHDHTPMVNDFDPRFEELICHRGDTVFFRFRSGEHHTNFFVYYWKQGQQPAVVLAGGRAWHKDKQFSDGLAAGCEAAFDKFADGKGYVVEMRIPWAVITGDKNRKPPQAGDQFPGSVGTYWNGQFPRSIYQFNYFDLSDRDQSPPDTWWYPKVWGTVKLSRHGDLELPTPPWLTRVPVSESKPGPVAVRYDLPHDANVTVVIEDEQGGRIRNLIGDQKRPAGPNVDYWDGANDGGRLVEPGTYRYRGLYHRPLDLAYQFAYGNPGEPPWTTADSTGNWLSDHANPSDVCADEKRVYICANHSESGSTVIAVDFDGRRLWGAGNFWGGLVERHGDHLYMVADEGLYHHRIQLHKLDPATGYFVPFRDGKATHKILDYDPVPFYKPVDHEGAVIARKAHDAEWNRTNAMGLTSAYGKLYVSLYYHEKLLLIDPERGEILREIELKKPTGLATGPRGNLFAISGQRVVRVDANGEATPVVTAELQAPIGLAIDAESNIYVSDWRDSMKVKVFSSTGQLVDTVGRDGGRRLQGRYDPSGMFLPKGLAVDVRGRLWVAEDDNCPRRVSVWSRDGTLVREFLGTTWYGATECAINAVDPMRAIMMGNLLELNWDQGTWGLLSTLWRPTHPDAFFGPRREGLFHEVVRIGQQDYLVSSQSSTIYISRLSDETAQPLAAAGHVMDSLKSVQFGDHASRGWKRNPPLLARNFWSRKEWNDRAAEAVPEYFDGLYRGHRSGYLQEKLIHSGLPWPPDNNFTWSDANGDGLVQEEEIEFFALDVDGPRRWSGGWRWAYDRSNLTLYPFSNGRETLIWKMPVKGWTECGAPTYDGPGAKLIVKDQPFRFCNSPWCDGQGNVLANQSPLTMFSPEGKTLWTYPNRWPGVHGSHSAPQAQPGLLIGPLKVVGSAELDIGEVFCMSGNTGQAFLMTTDGLYLGSLFQDHRTVPEPLPLTVRRGMSLNHTTCGAEWFGGQFLRHRIDGKIYIVSGSNANLVHEVKGLESTRRISPQSIRFTREDYSVAQELIARKETKTEQATPISVAMTQGEVNVDGRPQEYQWTTGRVARWNFDTRHSAEAVAAYDAENLYLCYRVRDDSPMLNSYDDFKMAFKTGDSVVFEMRTHSDAKPIGNQPLAGDVRLLFTVRNDQPVAIAYRYVVPGTREPVHFTSPVGTTDIDIVEIISEAKLAVQRNRDGYVLEASVPLDYLGIKPSPGRKYLADWGVIYSDQDGRINQLRMYWSNKATGIVSDLFSEARIQPSLWGDLVLD